MTLIYMLAGIGAWFLMRKENHERQEAST